jgi:hypothetical protein
MLTKKNLPHFRYALMASVAICALDGLLTAHVATAALRASTKAAGTYVTGDFHNHTTCTDGTLSMKKLIDKSAEYLGPRLVRPGRPRWQLCPQLHAGRRPVHPGGPGPRSGEQPHRPLRCDGDLPARR